MSTNRKRYKHLQLLQDKSNFLWHHLGTLPVVEVVLKVAVTDAKFELLKKLGILHEIQCVEDVKVVELGEDKRVAHQLLPGGGIGHVVEGVGCLYGLVIGIVHDGAGQTVEGHKVRQLATLFFALHHVTVDDPGLGHEPVVHLVLVEDGMEAELAEVIVEQPGHLAHVLLVKYS